MEVRKAIMAVLPELPELEEVDFSQYSSRYLPLAVSFAETGRKGLKEFEEFIKSNGLNISLVGNFLLSVFQYLVIRYRRYGDESVIKPAIKVFLTLKDWLNENGFENQWKLLLHNFVGYLVDMGGMIAKKEECEMARAYLGLIHRLAVEAARTFSEAYFKGLSEKSASILKEVEERCGSGDN